MWTTPVGNPAESLGHGVDRPELARVEAPQEPSPAPENKRMTLNTLIFEGSATPDSSLFVAACPLPVVLE